MALTASERAFLRFAARQDDYDARLSRFRESGCANSHGAHAGKSMVALLNNEEAQKFLEVENLNRDTQLAIELEALDVDKAAARRREEQVRLLSLNTLAEGILAEREAIRAKPDRSKASLASLCKLVPMTGGEKAVEEMTPAELVATARRLGISVPEKPVVAPAEATPPKPTPTPPPASKPPDVSFRGPSNGRA